MVYLEPSRKKLGVFIVLTHFLNKSLIAIKSVRKFVHLEQKLSRIQYLLLLGRLNRKFVIANKKKSQFGEFVTIPSIKIPFRKCSLCW